MGLISCKDCVFWYPYGSALERERDRHIAPWGTCHRHAASPIVGSNHNYTKWPDTSLNLDDGCGDGEVVQPAKNMNPLPDPPPEGISEEAAKVEKITEKVVQHPKYKDNPGIPWLRWLIGAFIIYAAVLALEADAHKTNE